MIRTCGKMALLDRLLKALCKGGSKVLISTQACPGLFFMPSMNCTCQSVPAADMIHTCGKMALLDGLLKALHKGGSKVLIFSQASSLCAANFPRSRPHCCLSIHASCIFDVVTGSHSSSLRC